MTHDAAADLAAAQRPVDVLILTALQDELDAVLALGDGGRAAWKEQRDRTGFSYHLRTLLDERGQPLVVAAAKSVEMGKSSVIFRAGHLIQEVDPACLAMCGICAGKRGDVFLGDVILADKVYSCDQGKHVAGKGFFHELTTYDLDLVWKIDAASFARDLSWGAALIPTRPLSKEAQRRWLLHTLYDHELGGPSPLTHPEREMRCPAWTADKRFIAELREQG